MIYYIHHRRTRSVFILSKCLRPHKIHICILDQHQILNQFKYVGLSVHLCNVCCKHCSDRKNEAVDFKFGRHFKSCCTQIGIENGPNRSKDTSAGLHKPTIPLFFKSNKNLAIFLLLINYNR